MADSSKRIIKIPKLAKEDTDKSKKIRGIFELQEASDGIKVFEDKSTPNKIRVSYNETVFFNPQSNEENSKIGTKTQEELSKILKNVITSTINSNSNSNEEAHNRKESASSINLNVKINNNYYNSNYNYIVNDNNKQNENEVSHSVTGSKTPYEIYDSSRSVTQPRTSTTSMISEPNQRRSVMNTYTTSTLVFMPCINCGKEVHVDDIESHSNFCTRVSDEVIKADLSKFSYHTVNYKLNKLQEHINTIKNYESNYNTPLEMSKEMSYISTVLLQYIIDGLSYEKINIHSIKELKKILTNLEVSMIV
jgi:hypothetical protein